VRIPQFDLTRQYAGIESEVEAALRGVLRSGRFILGPEGEAFEAECAATLGTPHAVGVASGSDALRLVLSALGIGPGDEVVTSAFSFVASATAVLQVGARPVFADVDPATLLLDPDGRRRPHARTRATSGPPLWVPAPSRCRPGREARLALSRRGPGPRDAGRPARRGSGAAAFSFYPRASRKETPGSSPATGSRAVRRPESRTGPEAH
jgi:hypothetical protein